MGLVITDAMGNTIVVDIEAPTPPPASTLASDSPAHMPPHKAAKLHSEDSKGFFLHAEHASAASRQPEKDQQSDRSISPQYTADDNRKSRVPYEDLMVVPTDTDSESDATPKHAPLACNAAISPLELEKKEILAAVTAMDDNSSTTGKPVRPVLSRRTSPPTDGTNMADTPQVAITSASGGQVSPSDPTPLPEVDSTSKDNTSLTSSGVISSSTESVAKPESGITANMPELPTPGQSPKRKGRQSPGKVIIDPPTKADFKPPISRQRQSKCPPPTQQSNLLIAYNQYGEIVKIKDMNEPQDPAKLTVTETLRLINKVYGYELRTRMNEVVALQMQERTYPNRSDEEDGSKEEKTYENKEDEMPKPPLIRSLSSWEYSPFPLSPLPATPEGLQMTLVYDGPPRVLEIGCGDGSWCFASKERHPDWIIEGVDDIDHWTEAWPDLDFKYNAPFTHGKRELTKFLRGFIHSEQSEGTPKEYFKGFRLKQQHPEFVVRNLNALLAHTEPFPYNLYGLIRGRDIFDRIESYKEFLEDVRLILQPDGVIEFVELDPRPRADFMDGESLKYATDEYPHISGPETDWTDKIADRFKAAAGDHELATTVEGWTKRVAERHKAIFRPKDGVPAAQLKGWLEGAGFWDVTEIIFRLQVGGETEGGKLLLEAMKQHIAIEDGIPLLKNELPPLEVHSLESGDFFLNLHIVTGRKPKWPRPGDLLLDGTRQEMTNVKYDQMAKLNDAKSNQWKRFDLDGKLSSMMQSLGAMRNSDDTSVDPSSAMGTPMPKSPNVMMKGTETPRGYNA